MEINNLLLDTISGSHAYGTQTPESDEDKKGIFILDKEQFYGLNYIPQISDEKNDKVYYEIGRFFELVKKSNPNVLELLNVPKKCLLYKHPLMPSIPLNWVLSKKCFETFAGYALGQIKKAKGLNKTIFNPQPQKRKGVLDFCHVVVNGKTYLVSDWAKEKGYTLNKMCLVKLNHFDNTYALYYDFNSNLGFKGFVKEDLKNGLEATELFTWSIPKGLPMQTVLHFNKNHFSNHCKEHKAYWQWVEKRNEHRYNNTIEKSKNYDAKNMMHTFRLLNMAKDIAEKKTITVFREEYAWLLKVKNGHFSYDELLELAEYKLESVEQSFKNSNLPAEPKYNELDNLLVQLRISYYS